MAILKSQPSRFIKGDPYPGGSFFDIHSWIFLVGFQSCHLWKCISAYSRRRNVFGVSLFLLSTPPGHGSTCVFSEIRRSVFVYHHIQLLTVSAAPGVDYFRLFGKRRISTCICSGSNLNKHCLQHSSSHTWVSSIRRSQLNRREGRPQVQKHFRLFTVEHPSFFTIILYTYINKK